MIPETIYELLLVLGASLFVVSSTTPYLEKKQRTESEINEWNRIYCYIGIFFGLALGGVFLQNDRAIVGIMFLVYSSFTAIQLIKKHRRQTK